MLSTMAQYLSARQTMTASRQVGIWRKVRGHMWLAMTFCSFLVMPNTRCAFTQARPRVGKAVHLKQMPQAVERALLVPVIEIEIVEEGPHGQRGLIGSQMEAVVDPAADHDHILAVLVGGHITVLDKLTHFLHLGVMVVLFQNSGQALPFRL